MGDVMNNADVDTAATKVIDELKAEGRTDAECMRICRAATDKARGTLERARELIDQALEAGEKSAKKERKPREPKAPKATTLGKKDAEPPYE